MGPQKDIPVWMGKMFFMVRDTILHSEDGFLFNDACARNNEEDKCVCCVSNHFDLGPVAEGAVKNKRKMLEAVRNLKNNGYNPDNFVKSLFLGDNEKAKIALDVLEYQHAKKEDGYCLFFEKENKICTIHPSAIGENIRGSICNEELCKGVDGYNVLYSIVPVDKMMPGALFACDANHNALGCLQFRYSGVYHFSTEGIDCAVIEDIKIRDEYAGKGIGSNLVRMLETKAKDKGCEKVITDLYYEECGRAFTDTDIDFFKKLGYSFKENGKRRYFEKNLEYLCLDFIGDNRHPE